MPAHITLTGNLGQDPELRFTPSGKSVLTLSVGCTRRYLNKQTNQWEDDGAPLWIRAAFWGDEHTHLADVLRKGDKVSLEGDLARITFTTRDGREGESLELRYPRLLGVIPRPPQAGQPTGGRSNDAPRGYTNSATVASFNAPAGGSVDDPWATSQGSFASEPPF